MWAMDRFHVIERGRTDAIFSAHLWRESTNLCLLESPHDCSPKNASFAQNAIDPIRGN